MIGMLHGSIVYTMDRRLRSGLSLRRDVVSFLLLLHTYSLKLHWKFSSVVIIKNSIYNLMSNFILRANYVQVEAM